MTKKKTARRGAAAERSARSTAASRVPEILEHLERAHPDAKLALDFTNPLELLVATILAAQARDDVINQITPPLFAKYPTAKDWAEAPLERLAEELRRTGYFNQKAKAVQGTTRALVERHGGKVPASMDALVALPGVGRKTANVVLGNAFGQRDRIAVDTHVKRVSNRLGLSRSDDPDQIEVELEQVIPAERRTRFCHLLQYHGRRLCAAKDPKCDACPLAPLCPSAGTKG